MKQKIGRLTIKSIDHFDKRNGYYVVCVCECGTTKVMRLNHIRNGSSGSCGCTRKKHGHTLCGTSPTYKSWGGMIQRCTNSKHPKYPRYGGRGISVCNRWKCSFMSFLLDMGICPKGKSLDRINNNGNYEPNNCRWATPK